MQGCLLSLNGKKCQKYKVRKDNAARCSAGGGDEMCDKTTQLSPDNVKAEYAALIAYHNSVVTCRFTLLGFFTATVAFIAKSGMDMWQACLVLFLTTGLYMVERRNRILYTQMSKRAMEIELKYWKLNRSDDPTDTGLPLFCFFRMDELPTDLKNGLSDVQKADLKSRGTLHWRLCSHSMGLDLFYGSVFFYALIQVGITICHVAVK